MTRLYCSWFLETINRRPRQEVSCPVLKILLISGCFLTISFLVRLLLIASGKLVSTLGSSACKNKTAALGCHAGAETECSISFHPARLVSSLSFVAHGIILQIFIALRGIFLIYQAISHRVLQYNEQRPNSQVCLRTISR